MKETQVKEFLNSYIKDLRVELNVAKDAKDEEAEAKILSKLAAFKRVILYISIDT